MNCKYCSSMCAKSGSHSASLLSGAVFAQEDLASYVPDVVSYSDYYPYGMLLPDRHGIATDGDYRYGFQGQEMDDELEKGHGNSVNYKYRMHDPKIGRFFAVDPLAPKYPHNSPYAYSENMVIHAIELEGLEAWVVTDVTSESGKTTNTWAYKKLIKSEQQARDEGYNSGYTDGVTNNQVSHMNEHGQMGTVTFHPDGTHDFVLDNQVEPGVEMIGLPGIGTSPDDFYKWRANNAICNPWISNALVTDWSKDTGFGKSWGNNEQFRRYVGIFANVAPLAPLAFEVLPLAVQSAPTWAPYVGRGITATGTTIWKGAKLYHNTFGKQGGYLNAAGNFTSQTIANKGDLTKTNLLGIVTAGLIRNGNGIVLNGTLNGISSGGILSLNADGSVQTFLDNPTYGFFTTVNGIVLGPTLSPVTGPMGESLGTGLYQLLLNESSEKLE